MRVGSDGTRLDHWIGRPRWPNGRWGAGAASERVAYYCNKLYKAMLSSSENFPKVTLV